MGEGFFPSLPGRTKPELVKNTLEFYVDMAVFIAKVCRKSFESVGGAKANLPSMLVGESVLNRQFPGTLQLQHELFGTTKCEQARLRFYKRLPPLQKYLRVVSES